MDDDKLQLRNGGSIDIPNGGVTPTGNSIGTKTGNIEFADDVSPFCDISLWGHQIDITQDNSIECSVCEMEETLPEILQMSSGFREVVYKLYILGKFRDNQCEAERPAFRHQSIDTMKGVPVTTASKYTVDVGDGTVTTDGNRIYRSTSPKFDVGQTLSEKEYMHLQRCARRHGDSGQQTKQYSWKNTVDHKQKLTIDTTTSDTLTEDQKKSLKERFAEKIRN